MVAPTLPLSMKQTIEDAIDGALECDLDDDDFAMKNDRPYSNDPAAAADRILRGLDVLGVPMTAKRRLAATRPLLVDLLRKTPLDDLNGEEILVMLSKQANLEFRDDYAYLPASAEESLREALLAAIESGVADGASLPTFARLVEQAVQRWCTRHDIEAKALKGWARELEHSFGGVVWYREDAARERLRNEFVKDLTRLLKLKWLPKARPPKSYSADAAFDVDDTVVHPTFGSGTVRRKLDGKVEVEFADKTRILAARKA